MWNTYITDGSASLTSAKYNEMHNIMPSEEERMKSRIQNLGQKYGTANNT